MVTVLFQWISAMENVFAESTYEIYVSEKNSVNYRLIKEKEKE